MGRWAEVAVALALGALVVVLSLRFSTHAGPLWPYENVPRLMVEGWAPRS